MNWTTTFPHRYLLCQRVIRRRKRRQIPGESIFRDSLPDGLSAFYLLRRLSLNGRDLAMRSRDYCYHGRAAWSGAFHPITGTSVRLLTHCSRHGRQRVSCWLMNPQLQLYTNCFEAASRPDPIRLDPIGNRKSLPVFVSRPQSARCSPSWTFESNRIRWDPIVLVYVSESWGSSDSCDGTDRLSLW